MGDLHDYIVAANCVSWEFPRRIVRLYETLSGQFWIRFDKKILDEIDGIEITHIVAYKRGEVFLEGDD